MTTHSDNLMKNTVLSFCSASKYATRRCSWYLMMSRATSNSWWDGARDMWQLSNKAREHVAQ